MLRDAKLLSSNELQMKEAAIKKELSDLDSTQRGTPHSSFLAKRKLLDNQLEMVLSELRHREQP